MRVIAGKTENITEKKESVKFNRKCVVSMLIVYSLIIYTKTNFFIKFDR